MVAPRERTLTAVEARLSPGERKDRALLLVAGSAALAPLAPRARLQIVGDGLVLGRGHEPSPGATDENLGLLDDPVVSGRHARIVRADSGGFEIEDLGSKNGTWVDNVRVEGRSPLRDGAVLFVGNHVAVFRIASTTELDAIKAELVSPLGPVATVSPALAVACDRLRRLATSDSEVFLIGETGVGKEVYARAVHRASGRKGRFVAINCGAIPRDLVESELFGYRAGAHSTAHQAKPGLLEEAEGGTLFLDEIGEMSPEAQIKILRFLQDRELTPLGGTRPRRIDVRIIAATNRLDRRPESIARTARHETPPGQGSVSAARVLGGGPGAGATGAGTTSTGLRDDIFARLGAAPIRLPPLRERIEDLGALSTHFLNARRGASAYSMEQPAFRALALHDWPLNVRELEKVVSTAAVLSGGTKPIALRDLPEPIAAGLAAPGAAAAASSAGRRSPGPSPTAEQLEELLRRHEGNVADVSRELGKHRAAVWRWIKKFGLGPHNFRRGD